MTGHFICEFCGYDGEHAEYCRELRPVTERWLGNRTKRKMEELRAKQSEALKIGTSIRG